MKWKAEINTPKHLRCIIKKDSKAGFYLYVYEGNNNYAWDDLQDTLEVAKKVALREFGVPLDSWKQVE